MSNDDFCTPKPRSDSPAPDPAPAPAPAVTAEPLPPLLPPRNEAEVAQDAADEVPTH